MRRETWLKRALRRAPIGAAVVIAPAFAVALPAAAQQLTQPNLQTLHVFSGGADGGNPTGGLISTPDGTLHGTTLYGGTSSQVCLGIGCGVVFQERPPKSIGEAWAFSTIYTFQGGIDGASPTSPLAFDPHSGALYGSTFGDSAVPAGNIFRLTPPADPAAKWTFENIYVFKGGADGRIVGASTPLVVARGRVFGITHDGGSSAACGSGGCGTFFVLAPPATAGGDWTKTVLFDFSGGDGGSAPVSTSRFDTSGSIYIATSDGHGAIVRLTPPRSGPAWTETVLYRFTGGVDGTGPFSLVLGANGEVFGIAGGGGRGKAGIAFELSPSPETPWAKTTIHTFLPHGFSGNLGPSSLAESATGSLIGVRFGELDFGAGAVFELTPPAQPGTRWGFSQPWNFNTMGGPSRNPENVVPGAFGGLYGVLNGGDSDFGAVFALY